MARDSENMLEYNYHDSFLKGAEREDRDIRLVIDTDIHWSPGKPITLLTLKNADNISELQEAAARQGVNQITIQQARIIRENEGHFNFKLELELISGHTVECRCYNFWTDRVESYKDYKTATHR